MSTTAMSAMDAVEIKLTIRPDQELLAERAMAVEEDEAEVRLVYFFDTLDLDLFKAGVVLRARLVKGDADDSTVKFRPIEAASAPEAWQRLDGFKLEADWVGDHVVCSASLTTLQQRDEIDEVSEGKRAIGKLFSKDQERFLERVLQGVRSVSDNCASLARFACCAGSPSTRPSAMSGPSKSGGFPAGSESNSGMPEAARVASGPGEMAWTRMPFGPSSAAT
jgi:hypothetical protein